MTDPIVKTYAPIPKDQKVLVVGVMSGNLGDALEAHPRVIWWSGDDAARKSCFPAGVGRVFATKFLSHATFDKLRKWDAQANAPARAMTKTALGAGEPGVHVVYQHGSTGQLKTAVYQSLGEHHPKWHPGPVVPPPTVTLQSLDAPFVAAGLKPVVDPAPPPAPPYATLEEYLTEFWDWQATESYAAQARALWPGAKALGVTKSSMDSFATMAAKWAREHRREVPPAEAVPGVPMPVVVAEHRPFTPTPIPDVVTPVVVRAAERRRPDSTAGDAEALLALVDEALTKAQEVISALEMVKTSLPGLVAGLAEKESRVEAAIAALRGL